MPRPRPPHLHRQVTRHGKTTWYVRFGHGPKTRIRALFGSAEFDAEYAAAINGTRPVPAPTNKAPEGSLSWLVARYRETNAWRQLSQATRRQRENVFKQVIAKSGFEKYRTINRKSIVAGRDARTNTPFQARHFLDSMRGLFRWALEAELVTQDPTAGIKNPKANSGEGFAIWSEEEVERYYAKWPLGTRQRVWFDVLLYTGLRRGDAVLVGRQHVRNGVARLVTEKSGKKITATIPLHPDLLATLEAGPTGDLSYICGKNGKPLVKESFGNLFKDACVEAGVHGKTAHGLRKAAATRVADNGGSERQLDALFGWSGGRMAAHYTRKADRDRLGREAAGLIGKPTGQNESGTSIPPPDFEVGAPLKKALTKQ